MIVDTSCDWVRPVWVSDEDHFTPWTARQILTHNEQWKEHCEE